MVSPDQCCARLTWLTCSVACCSYSARSFLSSLSGNLAGYWAVKNSTSCSLRMARPVPQVLRGVRRKSKPGLARRGDGRRAGPLGLAPSEQFPSTFCLTVHVVNRLAHGVPDLSCGISHVSHRSIGCTFVGHPIVTGKIAHALLDRACYRSDLAFGTSLRAPVESLA